VRGGDESVEQMAQQFPWPVGNTLGDLATTNLNPYFPPHSSSDLTHVHNPQPPQPSLHQFVSSLLKDPDLSGPESVDRSLLTCESGLHSSEGFEDRLLQRGGGGLVHLVLEQVFPLEN
jgi:hypothetical protein